MSLLRSVLLAGATSLAAAGFLAPAHAEQDPLTALANAICAAPDVSAIGAVLITFGPSKPDLNDQDIAEAFGDASFMSDLGRCANKQAIYDAFAAFKQGKDGGKLDAAFAMGRVQATPDGGTASVSYYQGSYEALGTAGDPPSGK